MLDDRELEGVLAHELSHVANRDILIGPVAAALAPLAAMLLQAALIRSREFEADHSGAELVGDGAPLASALMKLDHAAQRTPMAIDPAHATAYIVNPLSGRKVEFAGLFRSHPSTADRVARLSSVRAEGIVSR